MSFSLVHPRSPWYLEEMTEQSPQKYWRDHAPGIGGLDGECLAIHVTIDGRQSSWVGPSSLYTLLMRPGVLDKPKDGLAWLKNLQQSLSPLETRALKILHLGDQSVKNSPVDMGAIFIDFDARRVLAMHALLPSTSLGLKEWGLRSRQATNSEEHWVRQLLNTSLVTHAVWEETGKVTPVSVPAADVRWCMLDLERQVLAAEGLPAPTGDSLDTLLRFPLTKKGWSLLDVSPIRPFEAEQAEALKEWTGRWNAQELEHWEAWAEESGADSSICSQFRERALEIRLPKSSPHAKPRPRF